MKPILEQKCAKCHCTENLTRHHLFPKVHFCAKGNNRVRDTRVTLCKFCHRDLEHIMQTAEGTDFQGNRIKRQPQFYVDWLIFYLSFTP